MKSTLMKFAIILAIALIAGNAMATNPPAPTPEPEGDPTLLECMQECGINHTSRPLAVVRSIKYCLGLKPTNFLQVGKMIALVQSENISTLISEQMEFKGCMNDKGFSGIEDLPFRELEAAMAMQACRKEVLTGVVEAHIGDIGAFKMCLETAKQQTRLDDALVEANACIAAANAAD
ncbi:MAG: hypothetical protein HKP58_07245 [Desulfatitalea sp.]|nr:hypothetical protein [Desulfatitalea sp.]NNK00193.1 hypothetical protein [Desulfatitalea sp.]